MFEYFKKNKSLNFLVVGLILLNSYLQVFAATRMALVANYLIENNFQGFINELIFIFILWFITYIAGYFQAVQQEKAVQFISSSIRQEATDILWEVEEHAISDLVLSNIRSFLQNDVNMIETRVYNSIFNSIRFLPRGVFSLLALLFIDYILFIVALALSIIAYVVPRYMKQYTAEGGKLVSVSTQSFIDKTNDIIQGFQILKTFNVQSYFTNNLDNSYKELASSKIEFARRSTVVNTVLNFMNILSQVMIIFTTGYLIFLNRIIAGTILTTTELAMKIFDALSIVNQYISIINSSSHLLDKLDEYRENIAIKTSDIEIINHFESYEINKLNFTYDPEKEPIFKDLNLEFKAGNNYYLQGPSGSGKSSLLKIMLKILKPQSGRITLNGENINDVDISNSIDYLQQNTYLFDTNVKDNIILGRNISEEKYNEVISKLRIVNGNSKNLSGGEKQKVSLARVLVSPRECIILDESFSSLDVDNAKLMLKELEKLNKTLIIVTHRENELEEIHYKKINIR